LIASLGERFAIDILYDDQQRSTAADHGLDGQVAFP